MPALVRPVVRAAAPGVVYGDTRGAYFHVFDIYVTTALIVLCLIVIIFVALVLIYRRRPKEKAARFHDALPVEATYAVALMAVAAFLLTTTYHFENLEDNAPNHVRPKVEINVTGSKWEWRFLYPQYGIYRLSGAVGRQRIVVPLHEPVLFRITSSDVIHAFWIPEMRFKREAIAGHYNLWLARFQHLGSFSGHCAEFCGWLHSDMDFTVDVVTPAQFSAWVARERPHGAPVTTASPSAHPRQRQRATTTKPIAPLP